jgi:hypothetical protein
MHFDARLGIVPTNDMAERIHGRGTRELAVDPMQEIENAAVIPCASSYAGRSTFASLRRSMPISSIEPAPNVAAMLRNRSTAAGTSKFPIVDPGKKPSRRMLLIAAGSRNAPVKSPSTG